MSQRFVSEPIIPAEDTFETSETPIGEPPLPMKFTWRDDEYEVDRVLNRTKETEADRTHGSGEMYVRKHWFTVKTTSGHTMKIYFERQARSKAQKKSRWWLFTVTDPR